METSGKRTVQVNVKMSTEDFAILKRAADALWPDAIVSNSAVILGLAKIAAKEYSQEDACESSTGSIVLIVRLEVRKDKGDVELVHPTNDRNAPETQMDR